MESPASRKAQSPKCLTWSVDAMTKCAQEGRKAGVTGQNMLLQTERPAGIGGGLEH